MAPMERRLFLRASVDLSHLRYILCDIHMKDKIDSKLTELGVRVPIAEEYQANIFGKNVGSNPRPGLIVE